MTFDQATFKCVAPGVFKLKMTTDSKNTIKEANEDNNVKILEIKCTDQNGKIPGEEDEKTDKDKDKSKENS
jgi:subtilase family serine protease